MDLMKRFDQKCHAENLHTPKQTIALLSRQISKSMRPDSLSIEKARFSTKGLKIVFGISLCDKDLLPFNSVLEC
jgi:hypothetical protein